MSTDLKFLSGAADRIKSHAKVVDDLLYNVETVLKKYSGRGVKQRDILEDSAKIAALLSTSHTYAEKYVKITGMADFVEAAEEQASKLRKGSEVTTISKLLGSDPAAFEEKFVAMLKKAGFKVPENVVDTTVKELKKREAKKKASESNKTINKEATEDIEDIEKSEDEEEIKDS